MRGGSGILIEGELGVRGVVLKGRCEGNGILKGRGS